MDIQAVPEYWELDERDMRSILARNHVGRLAFAWGGEVDIRPLNYAFARDRLYGRTSATANFVGIESPARVAFEVDEVESVFEWKSVIARGSFDILSPEGNAAEWADAVKLLRRVVHATFVPSDPVPDRTVIFRILIQEMTGRASGEPWRAGGRASPAVGTRRG